MKFLFKLKIYLLILGYLFLQGCQTSNTSYNYVSKFRDNISNYDDSSICDMATSLYNGNKIWSSTYISYVFEAKKRGLYCGVTDNDNIDVATRVSEWNNSHLCSMATSGNGKSWTKKPSLSFTLLEVKRRGLNCGVTENNKTVTASNKPKNSNQRPLAKYSDITICHNATLQKRGDKLWSSKNDNFVAEARYRGLTCGVNKDNKTMTDSKSKDTKSSISSAELEKERAKRLEEERKRKALEQRIAELEKKNKELQKPKKKQPPKSKGGSGSGFFISKLGHIITNEHVVKKCNKITVGDNIDRQVPAKLIEVDRKNDLALLRTTTLDLASSETKSLIKKLSTQKLGIEIVPLATAGLMRSDDVELGEQIVVAGFPYGDIFSKDIKVTFGNVNSTKGVGDDSSQFQIQAPVQIGNSGGPIYDKYGNIVGVVVAQLDKLKMAKTIGSLPENVNFGIKASTVKQFLNSSGLPTKWAERNKKMSDKDISQIASKQTVMVVCHR